MHMCEDKCAIVNESIFLPSFAIDTPNSAVSTFSVKISSKNEKEKLNNLLEESSNQSLKSSAKHAILPPTLPPYYYTSTFPSLFATLNSDHVQNLKESRGTNHLLDFHGHHSMQSKWDELLTCPKLQACTASSVTTVESDDLNENQKFSSLQPCSSIKSDEVCDTTKVPMTIRTCKNKKMPICSKDLSEAKCVVDSDFDQDKSLDSLSKNDPEARGKAVKKNSADCHSTPSSGKRHRSMSFSSPLCLTHNETQLRRRRYSTLSHIATSPSTQRRRQRASTSFGSVNKLQYISMLRPTCSSTQPLTDRASTLTPCTENHTKSVSRKVENKLSKKELNTSFEHYYSAQLQANKAKINQRKVQNSNSAVPKQTFWTHSSESKPLTKRIKTKANAKSPDKSKPLHKLKDLKITSGNEKSNKTNNSKEKHINGEHKIAKGDASSKKVKPKSLLNQTTQTSATVICRLSDKSQISSSSKSSKSIHFTPAPLLSPDQLVIRDSIEKVRRWMKTLPKHFDAIQQVLPPAQQDY